MKNKNGKFIKKEEGINLKIYLISEDNDLLDRNNLKIKYIQENF